MFHYTYLLVSGDGRKKYIGVRSCPVEPEEDIYWSSSAYVKAEIDAGGVFKKYITGLYPTREIANRAESLQMEAVSANRNPSYLNRAIWTSITEDIARAGGQASKPSLVSKIAGGKAQGRRNVESGQLDSVRPEKTEEFQKKASARASRRVYAYEDPSVETSWNQRKATERRLGRKFTWIENI